MSKVLLVSLCLVCGSQGRRLQNPLDNESHVHNSSEYLESFATFLLSINPSLNARFRAAYPKLSHARTPILRDVTPRTRSPMMSVRVAQSTMDLASNCLNEGCPVDMVIGLLTQLKTEKESSPEIMKTIRHLEELIASDTPNKNAMESVVDDMLRTFTVIPDGLHLGYTGEPNKGGWNTPWPTQKSTMDLASNCLKEGCPADMVADLLERLKAEENPSEDAVKAIGQLKDLLALDKPNKNELERIVGDLARNFMVIPDELALGYTVKAGQGGYADKFFWPIRKSTMDLASNCLKEGCPADMVADLLEKLKAEENPSEDAVMAIGQLEDLLALDKPKKNELETFVGDLALTFTLMPDGLAPGYTNDPGEAGYADNFGPILDSTLDFASNCLKDGCPVDMVTDLLEKLKAEENPSEEMVMAIDQLEELLALDKPNKNELETFVGDLARTFTVIPDGLALGNTGEPGKAEYADNFFWPVRKSTMDLASNCLKEGFPVDMVTDLLEKLKAEENPSEEVVMAMGRLEKLLASEKPNKDELERMVRNVARTFTAIPDRLALGADLLTQLKDEKQSSPGVAKTIGQLKELIASDTPSNNPMESIVEDMFRTLTNIPDELALGYTGGLSKPWPTRKSTVDLASNCLKEGCPVDMVTDLLTQLKENPSPETEKIIMQLEELMATPEPNKNTMEQLVKKVVNGFRKLM